MIKNKIQPKQKQKSQKINNLGSSQYSSNTQHNFVSINQLSSFQQGEKDAHAISNIRKKYLLQNLINRLKFLIAPYARPPNMKQNWTEQYKNDQNQYQQGTQRQILISQIGYKYSFWHVIKIVQAICSVILFWMSSTQLVFQRKFATQDDHNIFPFYLKLPLCLLIVLKLVFKQIYIIKQRNNMRADQNNEQEQSYEDGQNQQNKQSKYDEVCHNLKDISKSSIYAVCCGLYLLLHILSQHPLKDIVQIIVVIIFTTKVWGLKSNMDQIYSYVEAKHLKNQFRILVLFFFILGVCHFIALVLYSTTYIYPQKNWINSVQKQAVKQNTWLSHYTCSIYFAITTMATVGYGDFSPNQIGQMFIVSLIQLFGSALFGYMINVVGLTVVQINKKNQQFDNHMSIINKLQNHYQISRQLSQKFKQDIIKNQSIKKQKPLSQTEQNQFFKMIQNSLKQQFILETNIRVIKKSIFFLTHFTVNFQNQIALKLIRKIYKKNQKVPLTDFEGENPERCMLIINSGSVDVELANHSSNIQMKKFIKNISPQEGKPTLNVFGYSALILNKDIDLQATTKDTSVIYLLKRKDVLQCMDKNMLDFQGIAQLRERMLQYKNINFVEGQPMIDIEKHYVPNAYFVNKKKKTVCQKREQEYERSNRKSRIKLITLKNYQFRTMMCIDLQEQEQQKLNQRVPKTKGNKTKLKLPDQSSQIFDADLTSIRQINEYQVVQNSETFLVSKIDQVKNYENFMKKSNLNKILPKYHEYLRQLRKQKKVNQRKQKVDRQPSYREPKPRVLTYTEGMLKNIQNLDD